MVCAGQSCQFCFSRVPGQSGVLRPFASVERLIGVEVGLKNFAAVASPSGHQV